MRHGVDTSFLVAVQVACHPDHAVARAVAEFLHVVTDRKRFSAPLMMEEALERAKFWWNATAAGSHRRDQNTGAL